MKKAWKKWLKISIKLSEYLANILLTIIYFVLIIPLSIIMQLLFKQELLGRIQSKRQNSYWNQRNKIVQDLIWAREQ